MGSRAREQTEFGLLTSATGVPVAIAAFAGNTADPATFQAQVQQVRQRCGVADVIWVADRGMLTSAQVHTLQEVVGARWITALRCSTIRQLVAAGSIHLSLFATQNLVEVTDPRYPGERLLVCHNPLLAERRARKREDLLRATERQLAQVAAMVARGAAGDRAGLTGAAAIGVRVGRVVNKYQMAKHFTVTITDTSLSYPRQDASISEEAALDGLYVLRTNVPLERLDTAGVVLAYQSLGQVAEAFRHFKLTDLEVRPSYHDTEPRVQAQQELLFVDQAPPPRPDPVALAPRSAAATGKDRTRLTADGLPVQSFRTLLAHLATLVKHRVLLRGADARAAFDLLTQPTTLQERAFDLLGVPLTTM